MGKPEKMNPNQGQHLYISTKRDEPNESGIGKLPVYIKGNGSSITDPKQLKRKVEGKLITNQIILSLIDIAQEKGDEELLRSFWNTYHCQTQMIGFNDRTYADQCKNRFCNYCCGIRKADIINRYYPIMCKWPEPHMVTLTARAVNLGSLNKRVDQMLDRLNRILLKHKKRYQRGKGEKFMGIKSMECTFNPVARTYHAHFHLIVNSKEAAQTIVQDWLAKLTRKFAEAWCQNIQRITNLERSLIEVIKYSTKRFTNPEGKKRGKSNLKPFVYVRAMYNMISAMKGKRVFERFGFNLPKASNTRSGKTTSVTEYVVWDYDTNAINWINRKTGEVITSYYPDPNLVSLLDGNSNSTFE